MQRRVPFQADPEDGRPRDSGPRGGRHRQLHSSRRPELRSGPAPRIATATVVRRRISGRPSSRSGSSEPAWTVLSGKRRRLAAGAPSPLRRRAGGRQSRREEGCAVCRHSAGAGGTSQRRPHRGIRASHSPGFAAPRPAPVLWTPAQAGRSAAESGPPVRFRPDRAPARIRPVGRGGIVRLPSSGPRC